MDNQDCLPPEPCGSPHPEDSNITCIKTGKCRVLDVHIGQISDGMGGQQFTKWDVGGYKLGRPRIRIWPVYVPIGENK